jgi:hypothetical protein
MGVYQSLIWFADKPAKCNCVPLAEASDTSAQGVAGLIGKTGDSALREIDIAFSARVAMSGRAIYTAAANQGDI